MAKLEIKDLSESIELDRAAMSSIYGGSKTPLISLDRRNKAGKKMALLFFPEKGRKT
ncbi:MAG: hypothetical protein QNK24_10235 [Desulfuromusa sp.]|nr:hypothetical protein [Desulfuromusa sp.]